MSRTLVLGSMRLTPCLLMAISRISGKFGSVVCCSEGKRMTMGRKRDQFAFVLCLTAGKFDGFLITFTSKKADPKVAHL